MNYQELVDKIRNKEMFSWSRWGDGEWNCIFLDTKRTFNCDRHIYFDSLSVALREVLESQPDYYIGLQSMAHRQRPEQIDIFTQENDLTWNNSNLLHHAAMKDNLEPFLDALSTREVLLVGPAHIRKMCDMFDCTVVEVPKINCWLEYEETKERISQYIMKDMVVCYCASMMSNVLIHDFAHQATQIDCGSVFDPYCGVKSRSYMRR